MLPSLSSCLLERASSPVTGDHASEWISSSCPRRRCITSPFLLTSIKTIIPSLYLSHSDNPAFTITDIHARWHRKVPACDPGCIKRTVSTSSFLPHSHRAPGVRGAGQAEDGTRLREVAGCVSGVVPVAHHHTLLVARHHQVAINWRPVDRCDSSLHTRQKRSTTVYAYGNLCHLSSWGEGTLHFLSKSGWVSVCSHYYT